MVTKGVNAAKSTQRTETTQKKGKSEKERDLEALQKLN